MQGGCHSKPRGPFKHVSGVWHYCETHDAKDAARAYHARSRRHPSEYFLIRRDTVAPLEGADASSFVVLGYVYL